MATSYWILILNQRTYTQSTLRILVGTLQEAFQLSPAEVMKPSCGTCGIQFTSEELVRRDMTFGINAYNTFVGTVANTPYSGWFQMQ